MSLSTMRNFLTNIGNKFKSIDFSVSAPRNYSPLIDFEGEFKVAEAASLAIVFLDV